MTIPCCYTDFITCGGCRTKQQLQYLHFLISTQVAPHGVCRDLCEQICALPYNNLQVDLPSCLGTPALRMTALNMAGWAGPFTSSASSSPSGWNSSAQVTVCVGIDSGPPDPDTKIFTVQLWWSGVFHIHSNVTDRVPPKIKLLEHFNLTFKKNQEIFIYLTNRSQLDNYLIRYTSQVHCVFFYEQMTKKPELTVVRGFNTILC